MRVIPRARRAGIEPLADGSLKVKVTAPAEGGRANDAVIEALAKYFDVPARAVMIVRGHASRQKLIEISCRS